jgi:hypothetical protein
LFPEAVMKRLTVIAAAALLASGCSPLMYPGAQAGPYGYAPPSRARAAYAPEPPPYERWDNVMRLPHGAVIDVLTRDGAANVGPFTGADIRSVRLAGDKQEREIDRAEVVRVDLVALPGSGVRSVARSAMGGALLGAGAAALFSAVIGGEMWPPPGVLLRGGAALGGVSAGSAAASNRQSRLIYLARF